MLDFINSKTGAFAAFSALVALAYALWRFWTDYQKRAADQAEADKKRSLAAQGLAIADVHLSALDPSRAGQAVATLTQWAQDRGATLVARGDRFEVDGWLDLPPI